MATEGLEREPKRRHEGSDSPAEALAKGKEVEQQQSSPTSAKTPAKRPRKGCTHGDGGTEKCCFRGVRLRKFGRWVAEIREPNTRKRKWLGTFETPLEAAKAYEEAAKAMYGPGARLNFPDNADAAVEGTGKGCMRGDAGSENTCCKFHGVRFRKTKWIAEIREPDRASRRQLGRFETAEQAARAYDEAAKARYGPAARLNFPDNDVPSK